MTFEDLTSLQATIEELRDELSTSRVHAEVFRALYTRQAAEVAQLREQLDRVGEPSVGRRLHLVSVE